MKLEVYDEDMTKDDLVGETCFFLEDIKKRGKCTESIKIQYHGKNAGVVK